MFIVVGFVYVCGFILVITMFPYIGGEEPVLQLPSAHSERQSFSR